MSRVRTRTGRVERKAVLLDIAEYVRMVSRLEELEDALELAESVRTARDYTSNWSWGSSTCHLEGVNRMEKLDRITVNPDICLGQPTIRGMRITVSVILKMLAGGNTADEVLEAYPELEPEDIQKSLKYAAWIVSDQIQMVPAG